MFDYIKKNAEQLCVLYTTYVLDMLNVYITGVDLCMCIYVYGWLNCKCEESRAGVELSVLQYSWQINCIPAHAQPLQVNTVIANSLGAGSAQEAKRAFHIGLVMVCSMQVRSCNAFAINNVFLILTYWSQLSTHPENLIQ